MKITITELIDKYRIKIAIKNGQEMLRMSHAPTADDLAEIKAKKADIIAGIRRQEDAAREAYEQRQAKIAAIEGLAEIRAAQEALAQWHEDLSEAIKKGSGRMPGRPAITEKDIGDMLQRYPTAAAYLRAEGMAQKSNYEIAAIETRALERIIAGEDAGKVMKDMDAEISAFNHRHFWD